MGASLSTGFKKAKVQPEMNVTPLVDVVLVLLIIFMVLAPVMAKSFWVRLPPKDTKDEQLDQANDPDKPLVLSVAADGKTAVNKVDIDRAELSERLTRMFNGRPDNSLYLDAADDAEYGMVLGAVDLARGAQAFPIVILIAKPE
jgi:biopolymer transport protein ExbD/biopolymer transport protein TolR